MPGVTGAAADHVAETVGAKTDNGRHPHDEREGNGEKEQGNESRCRDDDSQP
jgi:hypothetical protein